ncbi:MgtC family protein [Luteibacter sp. OK325]|uniref:MgtC/SapB family protein n=1 Tax=Luteibacter sp. OK325 TaxID=2135670 RepID=UPI000D3D9861|nr:MgtC/SapB family protein [Luteibacter sp. OK325]PTR32728.1 MgtC family protein [Luteibacter sp. OK325]
MIGPLDLLLRLLTAGLRTHMLVAVGAALAIIVSAFGFADVLNHPHVVLDPSRIAAQVVTGGLTTAASLWAVASVGLAAGSGMYAGAVMATAIIWVILALLKPLERRLTGKLVSLPSHAAYVREIQGKSA